MNQHRSERSKAAAIAPQTQSRYGWWWSPHVLLSLPHSVVVAPLSPQAAAPSHQHQHASHRSPRMLRVLQLTLVLALGSVFGRIDIHARLSALEGTLQSQRQQLCQEDALQQGTLQSSGTRTVGAGFTAVTAAEGDWSEYECVAWRETSATCTASDQQLQSRGCDESISLKQYSNSRGFCELRHKQTGESRQVLMTQSLCNANNSSDGLHSAEDNHTHSFKCADFQLYLTFARQAAEFKFDPDFSYGKCRQQLLDDQVSVNRIRYASAHKIQFQKGIALVHQSSSDLTSVYEAIQRLRSTGSTLPIELWFNPQTESEIESHDNQVLLRKMAKTQGVYLRTMKIDDDDGSSTFEGPFAKAYAAFYSAFDKVLVLDGLDSFAEIVANDNDPVHLFTAKEFISAGTTFWQDEYHTEPTRASSFMQTLFGLQSRTGNALFPQYTNRLLIDRRRNLKALNTLMYYVNNHSQINSLQIVSSEKDLYQIAWTATNSMFHVMATTSSALKDPESVFNQM